MMTITMTTTGQIVRPSRRQASKETMPPCRNQIGLKPLDSWKHEVKCARCGSLHRADRSCGCFDNNSQ